MLPVVEPATLHGKPSRAARALREAARHGSADRRAPQCFIRCYSIEATRAEIEDDRTCNNGNLLPVIGIRRLVLDLERSAGRGRQAVRRAASKRDGSNEMRLVRQLQAIGIHRAWRAATDVDRGHHTARKPEHGRAGRTLVILRDANAHGWEIEGESLPIKAGSRNALSSQ